MRAEVDELRRRIGSVPVRQPHGQPPADRIWVQVTAVPSAGRRRYTGKRLTYGESSAEDPVLQPTVGTKEYKFYNVLEAAGGTAFLAVGDELQIARHGKIYLCAEIPRGFV